MEETTKKYELRELQSKDVFPMFLILKKIGINEFKQCFASDDVKKAIVDMTKEGGTGFDANTVGLAVMFDIASVVISHIPDCEQDIYQLLSGLSGMKKEQIAELPMADFADMIISVFKQDGFMDFIKVVSKLFK